MCVSLGYSTDNIMSYPSVTSRLIIIVYLIRALCLSYVYLTLTKAQPMNDAEESRVIAVRSKVHQDTVPSLPYGTFFKKVDVLDLSSSFWSHVFRIPQIKRPPMRQLRHLCYKIPPEFILKGKMERIYKAKGIFNETIRDWDQLTRIKDSFCSAYGNLHHMYNVLKSKTDKSGQVLYDNMKQLTLNKVPGTQKYDFVPDWADLNKNEQPQDVSGFTLGNFKDKRWKRFLDPIGEAFGSVFGLATKGDIEELSGNIKTLYENQKNMAGEFNTFKGDMLTVLDIHWDRMDHISQTLNETLYRVQLMDKRLTRQRIFNNIETYYNMIFLEILLESIAEYSVLQDAMTLYQNAIQNRIMAIAMLNQHYLSPELVDMEDLEKSLSQIEQVIANDFRPFKFAFKDLGYFFSVPSTTYLSDNDYLYVKIKIPLTVISSNYHVFELFSVPLQASNSSIHFTQISNLPSYFAVSETGDTYATFDQRFLQTCLGVKIKRCTMRRMEISTSVPSCVLGLFLQDSNMTAKYCQTDLLITSSLSEHALDIGKGRFFLSMTTTGQRFLVSCAGARPRYVDSCSNCVISLGCRCNLKTANAFISASLQHCENVTTTSGLSKSYIPNLSWINRLENYTGEGKFNMTTHLDKDPIGLLPEMPLPKLTDVSAFMDKDNMVKTTLDQVLKQVKNREPISINKLQELSTTTRRFMFRLHHALPLGIAAVTWLSLLTFAMVTLSRKHSLLALSLKNINLTKAASIESKEASTASSLCLWYMTALLTIYICIQTARLIYNRRKKKYLSQKYYPLQDMEVVTTNVHLKLWTGFRMVILHMDRLCVPQHDLTVPEHETPIVIDIRPAMWDIILYVNWRDIALQHVSGMRIPLPQLVKIPKKIRHLVHAITHDNEYQASLLLRTGPQQSECKLRVLNVEDPEHELLSDLPRTMKYPVDMRDPSVANLTGPSRTLSFLRRIPLPSAIGNKVQLFQGRLFGNNNDPENLALGRRPTSVPDRTPSPPHISGRPSRHIHRPIPRAAPRPIPGSAARPPLRPHPKRRTPTSQLEQRKEVWPGRSKHPKLDLSLPVDGPTLVPQTNFVRQSAFKPVAKKARAITSTFTLHDHDPDSPPVTSTPSPHEFKKPTFPSVEDIEDLD